MVGLFSTIHIATADDAADVLARDSILRDPEIPSLGNPKGDVTIVEYFDYQCPYCKKIAPELAKVIKDDGNIRFVLKDWPIFGHLSSEAAKLAYAAKYQNKYTQAHDALIGAKKRLTSGNVEEILVLAGIDLARAKADRITHEQSIDALFARNNAQAEALGFQGTPAFIVGTFRVPGVPTADQFKQMIADVRAGKGK